MAAIRKDGKTWVDWTTGDPEGDRANLFRAYRDFLKEIEKNGNRKIKNIFKKWKINLNVKHDDFPRIEISRPEGK